MKKRWPKLLWVMLLFMCLNGCNNNEFNKRAALIEIEDNSYRLISSGHIYDRDTNFDVKSHIEKAMQADEIKSNKNALIINADIFDEKLYFAYFINSYALNDASYNDHVYGYIDIHTLETVILKKVSAPYGKQYFFYDVINEYALMNQSYDLVYINLETFEVLKRIPGYFFSKIITDENHIKATYNESKNELTLYRFNNQSVEEQTYTVPNKKYDYIKGALIISDHDQYAYNYIIEESVSYIDNKIEQNLPILIDAGLKAITVEGVTYDYKTILSLTNRANDFNEILNRNNDSFNHFYTFESEGEHFLVMTLIDYGLVVRPNYVYSFVFKLENQRLVYLGFTDKSTLGVIKLF